MDKGALKAELVTGLLDSLYGEMGRSIRWKPRWQLKSSRALRKVLKACPKAMEHSIAFLKKTEEPPALLVAAVGMECSASPESKERTELVELYVKHFLEAKKPLEGWGLEAWGSIARSVTSDELSKTLVPAALRMQKRNPAAMAVGYPSMVKSLTLDMSSHAKELLETPAIEALKDKDRKHTGRELIQEVTRKSKDVASLQALAESWAEVLKKSAKVDEKQALLQALAELIASLPSDVDASGFEKLSDPKGAIGKVASEDANEETRYLGYKTLGVIALRLPEDQQGTLAQEILKPLSDKKAPDRARLAALSALAEVAKRNEGTSVKWAGKLFDAALPLMTIAATKPVHRLQSLLAWAACGSLAKADGDALGSKLKKEQLGLIKESVSFLNAVPTIQKAPFPELAAQAQLWQALLSGHVQGSPDLVKSAGELEVVKLPPTPFAEALPLCRSAIVLLACLHSSSPERGAGVDSCIRPREVMRLRQVLEGAQEAEAGALILLLAQALAAWLAELAPLPKSQRQVSKAALRSTLMDICSAASVVKGSLRPEAVSLLAFAAHHPLLGTNRWPVSRTWRWLCEKGPFGDCFKKAGSAIWQALRSLIFSALKLPESDPTGCRAAAIALAGAFDEACAPKELRGDALQEELAAMLKDCCDKCPSSEVLSEKEENLKIYSAPEGRLWIEEGVYVAEAAEDKNVKKNKFLKGLYDEDEPADKKPAQPTSSFKFVDRGGSKPKDGEKKDSKDPKAAKGKGKSKGGAPSADAGSLTQAQIDQIRIQEQSEIRARIQCYVDEASFIMGVMCSLAKVRSNRDAFDRAAPDLMSHLVRLLKFPLTVLKARQCLRDLVALVIPRTVVSRCDLLPDALMVVGKGWLDRQPAAAGTSGDEPACEVVLSSVNAQHRMSNTTLAFILPIILRALFDSKAQLSEVCVSALNLLERQLVLGMNVSEDTVTEIFDSLSIVLLALPGQRNATQATMQAACKHLVSTDDQLARLADMFFSDEELVREAVINALAELHKNPHVADGSVDACAARAVLRLGALDEKSEAAAQQALEDLELESDEVLLMELIDFASKKASLDKSIQMLIAKAVANVLTELADPDMTTSALDLLTQLFREEAGSRTVVARCLEKVYAANLEGEEQVNKSFRFLLRQALPLTSSDSAEASELRDLLLASGIALIEQHGESNADQLFGIVEEFEDSAAGSSAGESARLGVAVFLGALSKHLGADHEKVPEILPRLLQRLLDKTSTDSVQNAITKVMPPLMKQNKEQATEVLNELMDTVLAPKTDPVVRRGAAMGVGATVKGLGITAVSQQGILKKIEAAAEDKKSAAVREGSLLCLEGLALNLGRLFDPYVVSSLPLLLQAFSDSQQGVRNASLRAAGTMMSQLSGPGVKQVLKPLLAGIEDKQWRTKLGSIELLASMTSCLPKQLAACLPTVVPALCTVINDQHAKVKEAARTAINKIGSIITSPELKALAPELISALTDGAQFEHITRDVMDKLLGTSFVHHIDAASLSLVCPLVQRALKERSAEMKRKGAQIVGSMVLLIKDAKDIQPYLPLLLPQLKVTLVDPIPDVRATSAKAFGTLANGLPEDMLGDVLPWLFDMLRSAESAVERSGAAHGLSEVLMAKGADRIQELLPDILSNACNKDAAPEAREGYLGLFAYLPVAMGSSFEPHIEEVLTALLNGMSDDVSGVRDTAFKAAQVITKAFGSSHTALLLPPLEEGVFDVDWRIRHGSVQLMGQLIEQILRAHRIPTNSAELMQVEALPREWRCHMLASLYIVRSDENGVVKQACSQVWKAVVQNTPRTLKELLPTLMTRLLANLASTNREKQRVAGRCVGDLVSKLGERVMPELMPIFMSNISTGDTHVREGVCIGLCELINATTKQLLEDYLDELIPAIQQAIIDDSETVRTSASTVVALLHNAVGAQATTNIVSWIMEQLSESEAAEQGDLFLNGLEQLMSKQPGAVLPIVLSQLTEPGENGWTKAQVQGLASIRVVPDSHTIHRHLSDVLPVLIGVGSDVDEDPEVREAAVASACKVADVVEQEGLTMLFNELVGPMQDKADGAKRAVAAQIFEQFFESTSLDVVQILSLVLPAVLPSALADEDEEALAASMRALNGIVKKCKKEELAPYLGDVRSAVLKLITDPETKKIDPSILLPGLCKHKGLEPLYPIYQHGLMFGTPEAREMAAKGLGELVDHTTEEALKPYVVKITGPLIRIVGDKFPGSVKKAIVDTLKSLLVRGGDTLKPFLPQLQTTYVKCLSDPPNSEAVRLKAAESLGMLVRRSARTEPLINELSGGVANNADAVARQAMCVALGEVLLNVPAACSEAAQEKILAAVAPRALDGEGSPREREVAGWALGMLLRRHLPAESAVGVLKNQVAPALEGGPTSKRTGAAMAVAGICWCQAPQLESPAAQELLDVAQPLAKTWLPKLLAESDTEAQCAALALGASFAKLSAQDDFDTMTPFVDRMAVLIAPGNEVPARTALLAARHVLGAAQTAGCSVSATGARIAAAAALRGMHKSCEQPEDAERALAAALPAERADQQEVKAALEKLIACAEGKAAQALKEYGLKSIPALAQHSGCSDFAWDL
eukprot:TRINITY_DN23698_c0_g1_i1.p1 TRINITY_DN23698_c0_g1~~TRINITY_DN23698_c0_g1_i1.p1  ORF type:complete len:2738 (+),score=614.06 TRINITY_DN23698_c0_g1_i1:451-8214(+)